MLLRNISDHVESLGYGPDVWFVTKLDILLHMVWHKPDLAFNYASELRKDPDYPRVTVDRLSMYHVLLGLG